MLKIFIIILKIINYKDNNLENENENENENKIFIISDNLNNNSKLYVNVRILEIGNKLTFFEKLSDLDCVPKTKLYKKW